MSSPLVDELAEEVYAAMADIFLLATLRKVAPGSYDPATGGYPAPATAEYACRAIVVEYDDRLVLQGLVGDGERKVLVLQRSPALTGAGVQPEKGDLIVVDGETLRIKRRKQDPAGATWELHAEPAA